MSFISKCLKHIFFAILFGVVTVFNAMACSENQIEYDTNQCADVKFSVTTSGFVPNETFGFLISASGVFYIDWGDGTIETYDRTDNNTSEYKIHTYQTTVTSGTQVKFGGRATGYSNAANTGTFQFGWNNADRDSYRVGIDSTLHPEKITGVSGRLGALFPTLNDGTPNNSLQPRFRATFDRATNLTSIPSNLFYDPNDIQNSAYGYNYAMFISTFATSGLTSIPDNLFAGVTGVAYYMFHYTFASCSNLQITSSLNLGWNLSLHTTGDYGPKHAFAGTFYSLPKLTGLPANLFSTLNYSDDNMFEKTFYNCANLTSIPSTLFSGLTTGAPHLFDNTFYNCDKITTIPHGLFSTISTGADYMFYQTFYHCSNMSTFYSDLFSSNFTSVGNYMFANTFQDTHISAIPAGLFSGVHNLSKYMFKSTFEKSFYLTSVPDYLFAINDSAKEGAFEATFYNSASTSTNILYPSHLFSGITGSAPRLFASTFGYNGLVEIPDNFFPDVSGGAENMFGGTFINCGRLKKIPKNLFSNVNGNGATRMFNSLFEGCSGLEEVPEGLFDSITSVGSEGYRRVFYNCSKLKTLPEGLFYNTKTVGTSAFYEAFRNDGALTSLPNHLFGATSFTNGMFASTFWNARIHHLPDDLFQSFTSCPSNRTDVFSGTFNNNYLQDIPSNLFSKMTCAGNNTFATTFANAYNLTEIPSGLFKTVTTPKQGLFNSTFISASKLKRIPYDLFAKLSGAPQSTMFRNTFSGCTSLDTVTYTDANGTVYDETSFLPAGFFGNLNISYWTANVFDNTFNRTLFATACPTGTTQYTGYVSNFNAGMNNVKQCYYNILYNLNGGTNSANPPTKYIANKTAIELPIPTKHGYTFAGWLLSGEQNTVTAIPAYSYGEKTYSAQWTVNTYSCPAGQYLPANAVACVPCENNNYCPASNSPFTFNETTDQGINECPSEHPWAPVGMWLQSQCGRKLHLGDEVLYMHQQPATQTQHQLKILYSLNNTEYSANAVLRNMNETNFPKVSAGATKGLHVLIHETINGIEGDYEYLICDDSVPECRGGE